VNPNTTPLRPYAGTMRRWPPVLELTAGTWHARVKVTPLTGGRGRATDQRSWEVSANWTGPGLEGLPPSPVPVDATDFVLVTELELAKAVAMAAIDEFRAARVPDLRALVSRFKERRS
jgi:hypothetical protein